MPNDTQQFEAMSRGSIPHRAQTGRLMKTALKSISRGAFPETAHPQPEADQKHAAPLHGLARGRSANLPRLKTVPSPKTAGNTPIPPLVRYWVLWRDDDAEMRKAFNMPVPDEVRLPHAGLCSFGFPTPGELMDDLRSKGWRDDALDHAANRIAMVEITSSGLSVTAFETLAAAIKAHKAGEDPEKLKPCPFCGKSDRLVVIDWTHERPDGSEYIGDAVKCDRCDAIAPLTVFQSRVIPQ